MGKKEEKKASELVKGDHQDKGEEKKEIVKKPVKKKALTTSQKRAMYARNAAFTSGPEFLPGGSDSET